MAALFGRAEDPLTGTTLGEQYRIYKTPIERVAEQVRALDPAMTQAERELAIELIRKTESRVKTRQAVAGYDLTFSPVKSVSALWATSDVGVQEQIVAAHHEAVNEVLALLEEQAVFTRTGEDGVAQVDTRGVIATAFDHWDTQKWRPPTPHSPRRREPRSRRRRRPMAHDRRQSPVRRGRGHVRGTQRAAGRQSQPPTRRRPGNSTNAVNAEARPSRSTESRTS